MELSGKEWKTLGPLLPELPHGRRERPWRGNREVLDGILWILRTGALGKTDLISILRIRRVIGVSNNGLMMERLKKCLRQLGVNCQNAVNST